MADTLNYHHSQASLQAPVDNALTLLVRRLEAATSRLEDIATSATALEQPDGVSRSAASGAPPTASAPELPGVSGGSSKSALPSAPPLSPAIADLDELMDQDLGKFEKAAQALNNSTLSDQVGQYRQHECGLNWTLM